MTDLLRSMQQPPEPKVWQKEIDAELLILERKNRNRFNEIVERACSHFKDKEERQFMMGFCIRADSPEFLTFPGSVRKHHAWRGGLLDHTIEVMLLAEAFAVRANTVGNCDVGITMVAGLWHDCAKVHDYLPVGDEGKWEKTSYQAMIRHVAGSMAAAQSAWDNTGKTFGTLDPQTAQDYRHKILHCILAHHGRYEWGSPVLPQIPEALILHSADYFSSCFPEPWSENSRECVETITKYSQGGYLV